MSQASAETRWWLASVLRHLASALPDIACVHGPLTEPPTEVPLMVLTEVSRRTEGVLGHQVSHTLNEQGAWVELTCAVEVYAAPDPWSQGTQLVWDALTIALAGGSVPHISEVEVGTPIQHGVLLVTLDAAALVRVDEARVVAGPWQVRTGSLNLRGFISRLSGGG